MVSNASRPVIGITTYAERASYGIWTENAAVLPREYFDSVLRAGGVPVLLPPAGDGFTELVSTLDGLVLSGGADVSPDRYGQDAHPETTGLRPDRDAFEFALITAALAVDLPVLAICRGLQVLNVAMGGTLHQHLPEQIGHEGHRAVLGEFGTCQVNLRPGARTTELVGAHTFVRCHHHQALDKVAAGLDVVGRAEDGTVEAVEGTEHGFLLGVQWHPEQNSPEQNSTDDRLMRALVEAATERKRP